MQAVGSRHCNVDMIDDCSIPNSNDLPRFNVPQCSKHVVQRIQKYI